MTRKRERPTWFLGGTLITQNPKREVLANHHLRVEGRHITAISKKAPTAKELRGAQVLKLQGRWVLPGFVQPHVHLCQTLFRNRADDLELLDWLSKRVWPLESGHTAETLYYTAMMGIHELLASGTTCILDMGTVRHTDSILEAVEETGIRANVGKCLMDRPDTCDPRLLEDTAKALAEAETIFAEWDGRDDGRIRVSYAPRFAVSCTEQLMKRVGALSKEQGARIHTHSSENRKEIELVRKLTGRDNVEYFKHLGLASDKLVLAHCLWLSDTEKKILRDTGTHVAHCPSSNLKLASGIAPIPELLKMGVSVGLAADGAPCNNNLNAFQELRLAALIHKPGSGPQAIRAQEALDLATLGGARCLGLQEDIGSLEVGKRADLFIYDPSDISMWTGGLGEAETVVSSLVYSGNASAVEATWVDGRPVYEREQGLLNFSGYSRLPLQLEKAWKTVARQLA
jgi:5-methylthioadenosine/S-adenosylhomocysteine deaminase